MKVTYTWLKDFVDITLSPQALADTLTMAGLEVKSIDEKLGDFVFEIEITSNRPDWLSVVGIAREVAAVTGRKLLVRSPKSVVRSNKRKNYGLSTMDYRLVSIKIEDKKDCPFYSATILENVKVAPSPQWLKKRLELVGCRSVNNVVDITNYVLFETGHPLHAFDLDKVRGEKPEITVRRARKDEALMTIDGLQRKLDNDILVIAAETPVAVAGIMGGKDTEVTQGTRNILLEAALFDPVLVRRGRQKLGVSSESSYRFERGVNAAALESASLRAVSLLEELAGAQLRYARAAGAKTGKGSHAALDTRRVNNILNISLAPSKIRMMLRSLGLGVTFQSKNILRVAIPSSRQDINSEVDLIEEVARIYGYDKIPVSIPAVIPHTKESPHRDLIAFLKQLLTGLGLYEAITYSLVEKNPEGDGYRSAAVENPLSAEQAVLRTTLLPGLARCIAYNLNQKQEYIALFEIAKRFYETKECIKEEWVLALGICGTRSLLLPQGRIKDEMGLLHLKGIIETILLRLSIGDFEFLAQGQERADLMVCQQKTGFLSRLSQDQRNSFDIKNKNVFVAEVYLEQLISFAHLKKRFTPLPLYPAIARDISFVVKKEIAVSSLITAIREKAGPLLREVAVTDSYRGKQIPFGSKGLTISCLYRCDERTLTEEEVAPVHALVASALESLGATLR